MRKILLFMTGGTICSTVGDNGLNNTDAKSARSVLVEDYMKGNPARKGEVEFENLFLTENGILSENMTLDTWNLIIKTLKSVDFSRYDGMIILHGTDTLAYTSSLMSILLCGIGIPVFMVSSNYVLSDKRANGYANFRVAADLILNGTKPNVYVPYLNSDGKMYVHLASRIKQCEPYSCDFYSVSPEITDTGEAKINGVTSSGGAYINKIDKLLPGVLLVFPYVGLNYDAISLDGCTAVLHATYHSQTVCTERYTQGDAFSGYSVLSLKDRCDEKNIPLFMYACSENSFSYSSTGDLYLRNGGKDTKEPSKKYGFVGLYGMTLETSYAKLIVATSLNSDREKTADFMKKEINGEYCYKE